MLINGKHNGMAIIANNNRFENNVLKSGDAVVKNSPQKWVALPVLFQVWLYSGIAYLDKIAWWIKLNPVLHYFSSLNIMLHLKVQQAIFET